MVAISSLAIILLRKKYLVVFGSLCLFFTVHWVGLQSLIAAFRDHTAYFFPIPLPTKDVAGCHILIKFLLLYMRLYLRLLTVHLVGLRYLILLLWRFLVRLVCRFFVIGLLSP